MTAIAPATPATPTEAPEIKPCVACDTPKAVGTPCQEPSCLMSPLKIEHPVEMNAWDKLAEGRARLLDRHEYLAHGVCDMHHPLLTTSIPTAAVGPRKDGHGIRFYFNPDWLDKLYIDEASFVQAHESLHIINGHLSKKDLEYPMLFNICADVVINTWLIEEMKLPLSDRLKKMLWDADKIGWDDKYTLLQYVTAEDLYEELKKDADKVKDLLQKAVDMALNGDLKEADPNDPNTIDSHSMFDEVEQAAAESVLRDLERNGTMKKAQKHGSIPAGVLREFERMEQNFDWKHHIERFMASIVKREETYERPHRMDTFLNTGIMRPGERIKHDHHLVFYVDMSGSIGPEEIGRFLSVMEKCPNEVKIHAFTFDTRIYAWPDWDKGGKPPGGGGTDFNAVVDHAESLQAELGIKVDGHVVLTDGQCSEPNPKRPRNWLWITTDTMLSKQSGTWVMMPQSGRSGGRGGLRRRQTSSRRF